jgi:histidine triad (HIT) family protein
MSDCIFCKIVSGAIPSKRLYEDEHVIAFSDLHPQAPAHALVIPRRHLASLDDVESADAELVGRLFVAARTVARQAGLAQGWRTVVNVGRDGGQTVFHLHVHVLGGRPMEWPPG